MEGKCCTLHRCTLILSPLNSSPLNSSLFFHKAINSSPRGIDFVPFYFLLNCDRNRKKMCIIIFIEYNTHYIRHINGTTTQNIAYNTHSSYKCKSQQLSTKVRKKAQFHIVNLSFLQVFSNTFKEINHVFVSLIIGNNKSL